MSETIASAVERIMNAVLRKNLDEATTKQGVILKLLHLAGWNTFDVLEVVPEYTVEYRRVDFALNPNTANTVFIEVKRPGENLENHQQQLLEYCFQEGVKLAVLTNGKTWWLYLPLRQGNWEKRRFLTIDLESQEPAIVEQRFMGYLSREKVISGQAVSEAENLVQSRQRVEITNKAISEAWSQIIETPDEILVDLISETAERICGFTTDPELVRKFLSRRVRALKGPLDGRSPLVSARAVNAPAAAQTQAEGQGSPLPITLDPPDSAVFLDALLRTKEAWIEEHLDDGRKELRLWKAQNMRSSSSVIGNLRSKPRYRKGSWRKSGLVKIHVTIERPAQGIAP
ncbi:MAG: hypothetical protein F4047_03960 [Caldilineaceae bacterium SB0670_bin_27]|uniref:Restriction endonuclease type I HsdR N-terminal domain-containing protein n=1 Tax=Caldilineaceae bacterium SB0664_bin_27 TaxID=2605260 RepID=A0A6B0YWZ2_9CHLR|nr:hypothetical protein [Caldilineaceae bacterium SB0664_bin_27]MYJ77311.1 hypothetical protein [Caldilineaceae bacterium SB0670_bin_27]